jgi:hypothetical protein
MANAGRLTIVAALALAGVARAAGPCEEGRGQTGLALAPAAAGLAVSVTDPELPAAASGLRAGDVVVQVNGTLPRSCADYQRAVREARKDKKALLVLARREAGDVVVALAPATWDRALAAVPAVPPPEPPSVKALVAKPAPPPLPAETKVTVEAVTRGLGELAPPEKAPASLDAYRRDLLHVHREVETLGVRRAVRPDVVDGLRTVLRYYDAAEVAWDAEEQTRDRERRPRHVPSPEVMPAPYFNDSEAAATIDEFPFLHDAVVHDPTPGLVMGESSGVWRPVQARALLWQHGREELGRLTTWLASAAE